MGISQEHGMLDVGHKPLWSASFLKKAKSVFARARRDHLEHMRRGRELGFYRDEEEAHEGGIGTQATD
jgi:hypothetical protein